MYITESTSPPMGAGILSSRPRESKASHLGDTGGGGGGSGSQLGNGRVMTQARLSDSSLPSALLPAAVGTKRCRGSALSFPHTPACFSHRPPRAPSTSPRNGGTCEFMFSPHLLLKQAPLFEAGPLALGVSR